MSAYMPDNRRGRAGREGFTLLELLTVMAIIALMAVMAFAASAWITRGYAMRSTVWHLTQAITFARQHAIMEGRKTFVIFEAGERQGYRIIRGEGTITRMDGELLQDEYADLADLAAVMSEEGSPFGIYRFRKNDEEENEQWAMASSTVASFHAGANGVINSLKVANNIFQLDDVYGFEICPMSVLAKGCQFGQTTNLLPAPIVFYPDGTTAFKMTNTEIDVAEKIRVSGGDPYTKIVITPVTGLVTVEYDHTWPQ